MSNSTIATIVFLRPVEDGLGQRHDSRRESDDGCGWPVSNVGEIKIGNVQESLDYIEQS